MSCVYVKEVEPEVIDFEPEVIDFNHILNNFEELVGEPLLVYEECEKSLEKYICRSLTDIEKEMLKSYVRKIQEKMYEIRQEMIEMDDNMYEEWYNWRMEYNYNSYDSYSIEKQIDIWENFKKNYEIMYYESDMDMDIYEEDYDY
jgi:hypothetical protein